MTLKTMTYEKGVFESEAIDSEEQNTQFKLKRRIAMRVTVKKSELLSVKVYEEFRGDIFARVFYLEGFEAEAREALINAISNRLKVKLKQAEQDMQMAKQNLEILESAVKA